MHRNKPRPSCSRTSNRRSEHGGNDPENTLIIETTQGPVTIELRPDLAPNHVARIKELARQGFYDGIVFHRVIDGFMAQTGDPTGTGRGGSGQKLKAEFTGEPHTARHRVHGARAESRTPPTASSSSASTTRPSSTASTPCGARSAKGMDNVDKIKRGEPRSSPDKIVSMRVAADAG